MSDRARPVLCTSCNGHGDYLINKTTDMEDSVTCLDCGGTGKQACPKCAHPEPGQPPHDPSPACEREPKINHCGCSRCFG